MQPLFDQHEGANCLGLQLAHHSEIMSHTLEKMSLDIVRDALPTTCLLCNKAFWWQCKEFVNLIGVEVHVLAKRYAFINSKTQGGGRDPRALFPKYDYNFYLLQNHSRTAIRYFIAAK